MFDSLHAVHYLPIGTTILSAIFCALLLHRYYTRRSGPHLLWWAFGIFTYGLGTFLESSVTLYGNTPLLNKAWYVAGAILGGYPLAQGSVYLHYSRRTAHILSALTVPFLFVISACVFASPTKMDALLSYRPGGAAIEWQWVRYFTPFINLYAVWFLIGSAIMSALHFYRNVGPGGRAIGNALIAFGAILPGIGGGMAKAGMVEALYIGEFVGLIFIWIGYWFCVRAPQITSAESRLPKQALLGSL